MAVAIAKVKGIAPVLIHEILKCPDMGIGQVHDMDVIPDTGAILSRVIGPKDTDLLPETHGRLNDQGDEMGLGMVKNFQSESHLFGNRGRNEGNHESHKNRSGIKIDYLPSPYPMYF